MRRVLPENPTGLRAEKPSTYGILLEWMEAPFAVNADETGLQQPLILKSFLNMDA
jgi:hypothetical protein